MPHFVRFRAFPKKDKAPLIMRLVHKSTPDSDYFYLIGLSTLMAMFGLLSNSDPIVIGSMLIVPLVYPFLGVALGLVMIEDDITHRENITIE